MRPEAEAGARAGAARARGRRPGGVPPGVAARLGVGPDDAPPPPSTARSRASAPRGRTPAAPGTTSTTPAGPGCSRTPRRAAAAPAGRPGRRRAHGGGAGPGRAARAHAHGPRRAADRLDDPRLAPLGTGSAAIPCREFLTGGLACYRIYETSDGRHLTVGALEPKFFVRLCELIGRPELAERQFVAGAEERSPPSLATVFAGRRLADWLELFDGEDVCVGPVATLAEAAARSASSAPPSAPVGQHGPMAGGA